jgi:DNA-binding NarL/FixJ family response regulator
MTQTLPKRKLNILIVDDHIGYIKGFEELVKNIDCIKKIYHARSGKEALELIEKYKIDLVFMDVSLSEMDGIMTTKKILKNNPDIKIIALSYHEEYGYIEDMQNAGVSGYLDKSVDEIEIEEANK